jgi:chromosome transmission fidelity protein 18
MHIAHSDERSAAGLKVRLEAMMEMRSMMGEKRPNCIILDEIDGTTGSEGSGAIDVILKLCAKDARTGATSSGGGGGGGSSGGGMKFDMDDRGFDDAENEVCVCI